MDLLQTIGHKNNQFLSVTNNHGQTALHVVVVRENFSMVQYLVEMGVQIDRNDNHGNSSYGLAETHGREEILLITIMVIAHMVWQRHMVVKKFY
jgi:ankyrin repeat protein